MLKLAHLKQCGAVELLLAVVAREGLLTAHLTGVSAQMLPPVVLPGEHPATNLPDTSGEGGKVGGDT